jgi:multimeric flavodoxin WrbA
MKSLTVNCTLKASPAESNTEALASVVTDELNRHGIETDYVRAVDHDILPGVTNDEGEGDGWPAVLERVRAADILIVATPTWLGQPSSVAKRVLERLDALISESDEQGIPVAYGKVAGVVVTGNEDGAHHVISEVCGALVDIGYSIPAQAWTYWNRGPGPGEDYLTSDAGKEWSHDTGRTAAKNLAVAARALRDAWKE